MNKHRVKSSWGVASEGEKHCIETGRSGGLCKSVLVYCGQDTRGYASGGLEELRVHLDALVRHQKMDRSPAVPGGGRATAKLLESFNSHTHSHVWVLIPVRVRNKGWDYGLF